MKRLFSFLIPCLAILITFLVLLSIFKDGFEGIETILVGLRLTARFSLCLFIIPYIARPLFQLNENLFTRFLFSMRKEFGIAFGFSFLSHLFLILLLIRYQNGSILSNSIGWDDLLIGVPGIFLSLLMLFTSFRKIRRWIKPNTWNLIHSVGLHFVWSVFFLCLLSKVVFPKTNFKAEHYIPFLLLLLVAAFIRIFSFFAKEHLKNKRGLLS